MSFVTVEKAAQGVITRPVLSGNIMLYEIEEPCQIVSITGVTVTAISIVMSTLIDIPITLPYSAVLGQKLKVQFSDTAPVYPLITYNKVDTAKSTVQDVAQSASPLPNAGYYYQGVFDSLTNTWYNLLNASTTTGLSGAAACILDYNFKIKKGFVTSIQSSTMIPYNAIVEHGNYLFVCASFFVQAIHKTTFVATLLPASNITTIYKFTSNNGTVKIVALTTSGVIIINPTDLTTTTIVLTSGAGYKAAIFSAQENRVIVAGSTIAKIAFINIESTPTLDGVELNASQSVNYMDITPDNTTLVCTIISGSSIDSFNLATRAKTNTSVAQLNSGTQQFVKCYGNYIYVWLTTNVIIVLNSSFVYFKTISNVQGNRFGLVDNENIWTVNGLATGMVSRVNLATEVVTNYSVNASPWLISKHPITEQIYVGCGNSNNALSVITP